MPEHPDQPILSALQENEITLEGQFIQGSNYTFLGMLVDGDRQIRVVYKPIRGEKPLWDFPARTLAKREVAAYIVSNALGWNLVPPTVYRRRKLPLGPGSLQLFIEHDPNHNYFTLREDYQSEFEKVCLFDLLLNNADRKGGHILQDAAGKIWLIDHGLCFHLEYKLRTVIWDFAGKPIPASLVADISRLLFQLEEPSNDIHDQLGTLISPVEIKSIQMRITRLIESPVYPFPQGKNRPYPWPPI